MPRQITRLIASILRPRTLALLTLTGTHAALASHGSLICLVGGPYIEECNGGDVVYQLDGSLSRDPSGRPITYHWTTDCPGATFDNENIARPRLTVPFQPGCETICEVEMEIDNQIGKQDDCHASIVMRDTSPPTFDAADVVRHEMWPPNHRLVCFGISDFGAATATDDCGGAAQRVIAGCEVDEASKPGACEVSADGQSVCLRVERNGSGDGRSYVIQGSAEDACGNRSAPTPIGEVFVPHDQRR